MFKYSFIIPHHNIPDLLNRCLASIPMRKDVQVIVVDDNSDIEKKPRIERTGTEIVYLDSESSNGAGRARNIGLLKATGRWILFADADDFYVDGVLDVLDKYSESKADVVYFNFKRCECENTGIVLPGDIGFLFEYCSQKKDNRFFRFGFSSPWAKMFRNSFIRGNNILFQELRANNDTYFVVRAGLMADSIELVNSTLYWYVHRSGSIANNNGVEPYSKVLDRVIAHKSVQDLLSEFGINTSFYLPTVVSLSLLKRDFFASVKLCREASLNRSRFYICFFRIVILSVAGRKSFQGPNIYDLTNCVIPK